MCMFYCNDYNEDKMRNWVSILASFGSDFPSEEDVWNQIKNLKEPPSIGNSIQKIVLNKIKNNLIKKHSIPCDEIKIHINSQDSSISVGSDQITDLNSYKYIIEKYQTVKPEENRYSFFLFSQLYISNNIKDCEDVSYDELYPQILADYKEWGKSDEFNYDMSEYDAMMIYLKNIHHGYL